MFNEIILIGRLAENPKFKETPTGVKLATLILDVERPYRNNLGIRDHDYISCVLWKGIAQEVMDCCEAGSFLGIKGRLQSKHLNLLIIYLQRSWKSKLNMLNFWISIL